MYKTLELLKDCLLKNISLTLSLSLSLTHTHTHTGNVNISTCNRPTKLDTHKQQNLEEYLKEL